tara:strand:- start:23771 stop:24439 length:669 start_codon:yes stop_codon:yes gene_type:complete
MHSSDFFRFKKKKVSIFKGWNNSSVIKLKIHKNGVKNYKDLLKIDKKLHQNEKIIILRKGKIKIHIDKKNFKMSKLDVLNLFSNNREIKITALENSEIFFVYCIKKDQTSGKPKLFNFKKDIKPKNLWGGECISRVYYGKVLNVVMFDLKKGFKFHDNGHKNEQITWLLSGQMEFYVDKKKKLLKVDEGVSIGKSLFHGGISNGAIGFDAFFPRRNENRYKN